MHHSQNEKYNEKYSFFNNHHSTTIFRKGKLIWIHLYKEFFLQVHYDKLKLWAYGLIYKGLWRINKIGFKIELIGEYGVVTISLCLILEKMRIQSLFDFFKQKENDAKANVISWFFGVLDSSIYLIIGVNKISGVIPWIET